MIQPGPNKSCKPRESHTLSLHFLNEIDLPARGIPHATGILSACPFMIFRAANRSAWGPNLDTTCKLPTGRHSFRSGSTKSSVVTLQNSKGFTMQNASKCHCMPLQLATIKANDSATIKASETQTPAGFKKAMIPAPCATTT